MKKNIMYTMVLLVIISMVNALVTETIADDTNIVVTLINQEPDPVAPGDVVDLRFRIENKGAEPAEEMWVKVIPKFPASIYSDEEEVYIGTVVGGQRDSLGVREKYRLLVDEAAVAGLNTVEFWYKTKFNSWTRAGQYDIEIRERDAVLAINEITTTPQTITPGSTTKVSFRLENLAESLLKDIKLSLEVYSVFATTTTITTAELPFTPIGSGNEKTLRSIGAREAKDVVFDLFTDADAESKVYKVPYILTYTDEPGNNFTRSGVVGLIVDAEPDLSVSIEDTQILSDGAKGTVSIKFVNKGFSDVKFLNVILKETKEFDVLSNQEVYVGNLDSDDFESAEFDLLVQKGGSGDMTLPLQIDYRDANGQLFEKDIDLILPLYSGKELKKRTDDGGNTFGGILIVLVIVAVGIFVYRKYRKKKKR
ncbi:hypothetical protein GOV09_04225 [Candidatus Woesearchaeota archaeon]|nr:hypothetical protein [Candidatus Woesearchaeota archaeon]